MKIPRKIDGQRETRRPTDVDEQTRSSPVGEIAARPGAPVPGSRGGERDGSDSDGRDWSPAREGSGAVTTASQATFVAALEQGSLRSVDGAQLMSRDVGDLMALLTARAGRPPAFAPAVDVLGRLKRLMEIVEARRLGMVQRSGGGIVEPIGEKQRQRAPRRELEQWKPAK